MNHSAVFEIKGLSVSHQQRIVLSIDYLALPWQQTTAIIGPNGAGKSTLLKALLGQHECASLSCMGMSAQEATKQGKIAWVGQHELFGTPLTVQEYALLGRYPHLSWFAQPTAADRAQVSQLLAQFDLSHLAEKRIGVLSGGEQQRAAMVRALMQETEVLLLDEPSNHLDIKHQHQLMRCLRPEALGQSLTTVMVLHDLNLAANYAEHIVLLSEGAVLAQGPVAEVMTEALLSEAYGWPIRPYQHPSGYQAFDSFGY
ncbi:MAG: ABC transporter ATP-binding protein [Neisseriaceae bacterium]|nr:ABC transporter ATP-binding protein [Neisseriaceae bacterium]MBP6862120.1 ABC transporter ATP-binding protein [Neisseriaceae bacterium]